MAGLVNPDPGFWKGKRVLVTGHTGFKGSWLMVWLSKLGAVPFGLSLRPESDTCPVALVGPGGNSEESFGDIRDGAAVVSRFSNTAPDIVLHLAAQALVRRSYAEPVMTFETNVMGTLHVLEAVRRTPLVRAVVVVTSDKSYDNREWHWPYREDDTIGGHDPYSASKACAELVTAAWRRSFLGTPRAPAAAATARAGNVIGGGDFAVDRLLPTPRGLGSTC
jgi:CDP-glucose 4,6-dehydratase